MPQTISVRMPDGTIIKGVPDGMTQEEVQQRYALLPSRQPTAEGINQSALYGPPPAAAPAPEPPPDNRNWRELAGDKLNSVLSGRDAWDVVKGIPQSILGMAKVPAQLMTGQRDEAVNTMKGMAEGIVRPWLTPVLGAVSGRTIQLPMAGGPVVKFPEMEEGDPASPRWDEARKTGVATALGAAAPELPPVKGVAKYIREAPVRKGYTTLNPETLKPVPPEPPILVKHGQPTPEIPKGRLAAYEYQTQKIADGMGLADTVEGNVLRDAIADVYPELRNAQANTINGQVNTPAKFRAVLDWAGDRIWTQIMEPEIKQSGPMQNLSNLSADVQAALPEHVKAFYGDMVKAGVDPIQEVINTFKRPGEAIPQVDPMLMHGLAKTIRAKLNLAATPMEQALQRQMPQGEILFELNKVLRDKLYDHVKMTRDFDMRTAARKYGRIADIKGEAADLTTPKGFFETLFTSYTFPTPRAVAARIGETAGKQLVNNMKALNKGFKGAMTPEETASVVQPRTPKSWDQPRGSIGERGADIPVERVTGYEQTAQSAGTMAPEAPPAGAYFRNIAPGPTPTGEANWPVPTKPGTQTPFGERATPQWTGQPGKPGEFFPGKRGIIAETVGTDPKTGKPIKEVRDYRNQGQLFSVEQTPPPRWQPTAHETSTLKDLLEIRNEIVSYLAKVNPQGKIRQDYIADVKALQAEITRRQAAQRTKRATP